MNDKREYNLYVRVSEKEKSLITKNAYKCGLSVSEYLRQRALMYNPKVILPDEFYEFNEKLDNIYSACEGHVSPQTEVKLLNLLDEITKKLILP